MTTFMILGIIFTCTLVIWVFIGVRAAKNPSLNKEELRFILAITLIGTFTGVWGAFTITEYDQQTELNQVTKQKLRLAILEAASTCSSVSSVLSGYLSSDNLQEISFPKNYPGVGAAKIALYDENIHMIVPEHKISLLLHYTDSITSFTEYMYMYQDTVLSNKASESTLNVMRSTSAEALAVCKHLLDEFVEYYEISETESNLTQGKVKKGREAIEALKQRALNGENILKEQ